MLRYSVSVVLDTRTPRKDNTYPVKLRVTYQRKHYYATLNQSFTKDDWEAINSPKARGQQRTHQLRFRKLEVSAHEILDKMKSFSLSKLKQDLFGEQVNEDDFFTLIEFYIEQLVREQRYTTATTFRSTKSIVKSLKFDARKKSIPFNEIDQTWLEGLEATLLKLQKSPSTIGKHMRNIRVIYNLAIEKGHVEKENYPFGKRKYQIPATTNHKRALSQKQIAKLISYECIAPQEKRARDYWLFSYLAAGINMKDMSRLRYKDLKGDVLSFYRAKTEKALKSNLKAIEVVLHPKALEIINDYGQKPRKPESLIFDLVSKQSTKQRKVEELANSIAQINKYLKRIGQEIGLPFRLTTYTARHSYATVTMKSGAPIQFISENLGHSSLEVTTKYLGSFDEEVKREWSNKLMDF